MRWRHAYFLLLNLILLMSSSLCSESSSNSRFCLGVENISFYVFKEVINSKNLKKNCWLILILLEPYLMITMHSMRTTIIKILLRNNTISIVILIKSKNQLFTRWKGLRKHISFIINAKYKINLLLTEPFLLYWTANLKTELICLL